VSGCFDLHKYREITSQNKTHKKKTNKKNKAKTKQKRKEKKKRIKTPHTNQINLK
jgi:hypothetical protein